MDIFYDGENRHQYLQFIKEEPGEKIIKDWPVLIYPAAGSILQIEPLHFLFIAGSNHRFNQK
jgi:hypothetical protein